MSINVHDSREIGSVFESGTRVSMEAKTLEEWHLVPDNCLRKCLPSSHKINYSERGSAVGIQGRYPSNQTDQGIFSKRVWLLGLRIHVSGFVEQSTTHNSDVTLHIPRSIFLFLWAYPSHGWLNQTRLHELTYSDTSIALLCQKASCSRYRDLVELSVND